MHIPGHGQHIAQTAGLEVGRTRPALAAALPSCSFLPQALHTFRARDVSGISLGMYSTFTLGVALWLAYGVALADWPIVVANAITLALAGATLGMKLRYGARRRA